jgi:UDP-3-O-[3-hydroxymyristoyl] glucosamine N-acyltransferase LpxD
VLRATLNEREIRQVLGLPAEGDRSVDGVAPLGAGQDRCLYFVNKKLDAAARAALAERRGCIVIAPSGSGLPEELGDCVVVEAAQPRAAIALVLEFIHAEGRLPPIVNERQISPSAVISPLAVIEGAVEIGDEAVIEAFCLIGPHVRIGRGTRVRSGARLFPRVVVGDESVVGVNTVVGQEGYGFVRDADGNKKRIPHLGGVVIGSHVEIGALTAIQGGTIVPTVVEDHVKMGDQIFVGHNVRIARGASLTAGVVIGGSGVIGTDAWVGINSTVRDGRRVGAHALVGMDASVQDDLADNMMARAPRAEVAERPQGDHSGIGFTVRQR